ncbi:MAG: hypothetical protein KAS23_03670, partial [Anaerohalosphaera sp.]|nr:hypothetical protein [Anaerohalosphaera sp.]
MSLAFSILLITIEFNRFCAAKQPFDRELQLYSRAFITLKGSLPSYRDDKLSYRLDNTIGTNADLFKLRTT